MLKLFRKKRNSLDDEVDKAYKLMKYNPYDFNKERLRENLQKYEKVYSVDTSVLLLDPFAIFYLTGNEVPNELQSEFADRYGLYFSREDQQSGEPNNLVLSQVVEYELDKVKDNPRKDEGTRIIARRALEVIRYIYHLGREQGEDPKEGIKLKNGAYFIYVPHDEVRFKEEYKNYFEPDHDVRIISDISHVLDYLREDQTLTIVTQDGGFVNKAEVIGIKCKLEEYKREQVSKYESAYSGKQVLNLEDENLKSKYSNINILVKKELSDILSDFGINPGMVYPNMVLKFEPPISEDEPWRNYLFVTGDKDHIRGPVNFLQYLKDCEEFEKKYLSNRFNNSSNGEDYILLDKAIHLFNKIKNQLKKKGDLRVDDEHVDPRKIVERVIELFKPKGFYSGEGPMDFRSVQDMFDKFPFHRNIKPEKDQIPYFELLLSKEIPVVSVIGEQGAGKSVLALLAGLYQVWKGDYERISYIRSTREMGASSIGFLPGSESDKMEPWKRSVRDNLIDIFYDKERRGDLYYKKQVEEFIHNLEKNGLIEFLTPQFLQGRTLNDRFIIVDEAQNFPRTVASIILGRTGETSKMVFLGDPKQLDAVQYSDRFVNKYNTGILHVAERLKDLPVTAHITLPPGFNKRSEASKAATLL